MQIGRGGGGRRSIFEIVVTKPYEKKVLWGPSYKYENNIIGC